MGRTLVFGLALLVGGTPAAGQGSAHPFEHLTLKDGLPNPSVLDIVQDEQGFLWFATVGGIVRYDGYEMRTYRPAIGNADTLPARTYPVLGIGPQGEILVGYAWGDCRLYRYDPTVDRFQPMLYDTLTGEHLFPLDDGISSLFSDSRGRLWIGTFGIGVFVVEGEEVVHYAYEPDDPASPSFPTSDVLGDMVEDSAGNIWMPTLEGLCQWEATTGKFRLYPFSEKDVERPNQCYSLLYTSPYTLWVGSTYEGLLRFDLERKTFRSYPLPAAYQTDKPVINDLVRLPNGKLSLAIHSIPYISPSVRPLLFDPIAERWSELDLIADEAGLENTNWVDYAGNLWIGSWQKGLIKYDLTRERIRRWSPLLPFSGTLRRPYPLSIAEDSTGEIWIGTKEMGLYAWTPAENKFRDLPLPTGSHLLPDNEIKSAHTAGPRALWLARYHGAEHVSIASGRTRTSYFTWQGQKIEDFVLHKTGPNQYWLSRLYFGVCELRESSSDQLTIDRCYTRTDSTFWLNSTAIIKTDPRGRTWFGTNQNGLYILDRDSGRFDYHIPEYGVLNVFFDRWGTAWLATHSSGLKGYDPDRRRLIHLDRDTRDALGMVYSIQEDGEGMLWMLNVNGLVQFDPRRRQILRQISAANWRSMAEYNNLRIRPSLKTSQGALVFGERYGVIHFHPDSLLLDTIPPRLAFTDFKLFNESVAPGPDSLLSAHISRAKPVRLAHWQNDIAVQFAALHFKNPEEYRYRYRLAPVNTEMIYIGSRREVFFTGLRPGHYTLHVEAANADGAWNETGIQLAITVQKPWWATTAAYVLYGLLVLVVSFVVYRFFLRRKLRDAEYHRLRELDDFKNKVFTNITHEFRTPLTLILGVVDRVRLQAAQMFHPDLRVIEQQGHRLLRLVNRMLDLAQLEAGQLRLEPVQSDIHFFLRYVTQTFETLAQDKQLDLHCEVPREPFLMDFDPGHLEQVITNLVWNAIKFTPAGGRIEVSGAPIAGDMYRIDVADTGPGIPPELQTQIFQRFFRTSDADPQAGIRKGEGTGIGLALCRELVQLMGGTIAVDSALGKGTRFSIELPVTRRAPLGSLPLQPTTELHVPVENTTDSRPRTSPEPMPTDSAPLALVVEDNADLRIFLRDCLAPQFRIMLAEDGQAGWELALELTPDLIVSDVMMPRMDGFELCGRLKADRRTSHIPVVLLTAKVDAPSRLTGRRQGADTYLTKPFLAEELRLIARNLLDHRRRLQSFYQSLAAGQSPPPPAAEEEMPEEAAFVTEVRAHILAHLGDTDLNVEALATTLNMGRTQLYRKLKSLAGITPVALIRQVRLAEAKTLLRTTDLQIAQVAYACGFSDPGFFGRVFRESFGVTPGEWRKG